MNVVDAIIITAGATALAFYFATKRAEKLALVAETKAKARAFWDGWNLGAESALSPLRALQAGAREVAAREPGAAPIVDLLDQTETVLRDCSAAQKKLLREEMLAQAAAAGVHCDLS